MLHESCCRHLGVLFTFRGRTRPPSLATRRPIITWMNVKHCRMAVPFTRLVALQITRPSTGTEGEAGLLLYFVVDQGLR